ncbi:hypothetical protein GDO78_013253 [Eleutherodactylus coqui]|uniref:Uncharacterized protein n=1 Tax=Eleutherodactylus coqui TaxID=57060 RepID=A0A8J6EXY5_ELECQ|nr:hypothetical protein GDO78_013253 [Eleutherodactylus coqui]
MLEESSHGLLILYNPLLRSPGVFLQNPMTSLLLVIGVAHPQCAALSLLSSYVGSLMVFFFYILIGWRESFFSFFVFYCIYVRFYLLDLNFNVLNEV